MKIVTVTLALVAISLQLQGSEQASTSKVQTGLERIALSAIPKLKGKLLESVKNDINKGILQLEGMDTTCMKQGQDKLMHMLTTYQHDLGECSVIISDTLNDAEGLIKVGGGSALWVFESIWAIVDAYKPCFNLDANHESLSECIFTSSSQVIDIVGKDGIVAAKYGLDIAAFVFKTVLRVWACLDQEVIESSIQKAVSEAQTCNMLV